ncbi:MAG TPA: hypothetical protein VGB94_11055 [Acidobacteriaceae bacterium]
MRLSSPHLLSALTGAMLSLALTGCALHPTATPSSESGAAIHGMAHGGRQAIAGAHVYLFSAGTGGYGAASTSLLDSSKTGYSDSIGAYVPTGSDGYFTITGDYTCTANTQVYLYILGGNTGGGGVNSASGLLAILGNCPAGGSLASAVPFVVVNEVTTVAAAYAFAGFATAATYVSSSGTALAQTGIANAFANATNLTDLTIGAALATTPAGNGTVPQATINTLANTLTTCVNSADVSGSISAPCNTLFAATLSGGTTGTTPTDTATAAINIAHNPGSNIATLYGLTTANQVFSPALTAQPNDWTLTIVFTGNGVVSGNGQNDLAVDSTGNIFAFAYPYTLTKFSPLGGLLSPATGYASLASTGTAYQIGIDSFGNVWIPVYSWFTTATPPSILKLANDGTLLSPSTGYAGGGLSSPFAVAFDASDNAWIVNYPYFGTPSAPERLSELSNTGVPISSASGFTGGGITGAEQMNNIAISPNGNVWIPNVDNNTLVGFASTTGTALTGSAFSGGGIRQPNHVAVDSGGNVWVANQGATILSKFTSTGAPVSTTGYTGGGLDDSLGLALDGGGNAWTVDLGGGYCQNCAYPSRLTRHTNAGVAVSPSTGYTLPVSDERAIAIDGSGNVWTYGRNYTYTTSGGNTYQTITPNLSETVGAAVPVVTPISLGLKNGMLATRP